MLAVVIPSHRPDLFKIWYEAWKPLFEKHNIKVYFVEDRDEKSDLGLKHHFYHADFPDFVPQGSGSCRSLGFLKAYQDGYDVITLDHDCMPTGDPIQAYLDSFDNKFAVGDYFDVGNVLGLGEYMRGYPFNQRNNAKPLIQYGGWDNVPDMDAITQGEHEKKGKVGGYRFDRRVLSVPKGLGVTGCMMNVAIKHEAIPLVYQLIMGVETVGYDRWDDIWSGLFAKKICDHLGIPILINGKASIVHTRLSDTAENLRREMGGYRLNETLWTKLSRISLEGDSPITCYQSLINQLKPKWFGKNGDLIIKGMQAWLDALS